MLKISFVRLLTAIMTSAAFALCGAAAAAAASDIEGHWAERQIAGWMERGYVKGYEDGSFRPDRPVTRAEFAALVNRAFGFSLAGDVPFSDVPKTHWAYRDIAIAVRAGYVSGYGDGNFGPEKEITRQEAAVIAARLINSARNVAGQSAFSDRGEISGWALQAVDLAAGLGVLTGYPEDQTFRPLRSVTRAEAVAMLDRALGARTIVYDQKGTYGPQSGMEIIHHDVVIKAAGVTIRNMEIRGNLTLAEEIGDGDVFLKNVAVRGNTSINGGGENSVYVTDSVLVSVTVDKKDGGIRIVVEGATTVTEVVINTPVTLDAGAAAAAIGSVKLSENLPEGSKVTLTGTFENVEVAGSDIVIEIPAGSVENFVAAESAEGMTLNLGEEAKVAAMILEAVAKVTGSGTVAKVTVSEKAAAETTLEVAVEEVVVPEGVPAPVVQAPPQPAPPSSSDDGPSPIRLSGVAVSGSFYVGETVTAVPAPAGATVLYQWQRSDAESGPFVNIPGASEKTYQIRAEDEGKWIRVNVTGTGNYYGTSASQARKAERFVSAGAGVAARDFGVFTHHPEVFGYSVGFELIDATAADVKEVMIALYKGIKELARVTSGKVLENYADRSSLSAPFDVTGGFDYGDDEGGNWIYSGWNGYTSDIPDRAEVTVTFKNNAVKTAALGGPTGDTSVFAAGTVTSTAYWGNPINVLYYFDFELANGFTVGDLESLEARAYDGDRLLSAISLKEERFADYASLAKLGGSFRSNPELSPSSSWNLEAFDGTMPTEIVVEYRTKDGKTYRFGARDAVWKDEGYRRIVNIELKTGYNTIQEAVDAAVPGNNTIEVYPGGDYGTGSIAIVQREGVNIELAAKGDVTLKNRILIDGDGRSNGTETLTIRGFTFDFSDSESTVIISAKKGELGSTKNNYAHNITIEDVRFIGNPSADVAAIGTTTGATFGLTIRNCEGIYLHSLGQLHVARGFTVENCTVTAREGGISFYGNGDAVITNLTVQGTSYGVRAGQSSGTVNANGTLTITSSHMSATYPVWLRANAPHSVTIVGSELSPLAGGTEIRIDANEEDITLTVIPNP